MASQRQQLLAEAVNDRPHIPAAQATGDHKPPVTDAHLRTAFKDMAWPGWTFEQAQADPLRWKQVEIRATLLRNREWRASLGLPVPTVPKGRTQHNFTMPPGVPRIF